MTDCDIAGANTNLQKNTQDLQGIQRIPGVQAGSNTQAMQKLQGAQNTQDTQNIQDAQSIQPLQNMQNIVREQTDYQINKIIGNSIPRQTIIAGNYKTGDNIIKHEQTPIIKKAEQMELFSRALEEADDLDNQNNDCTHAACHRNDHGPAENCCNNTYQYRTYRQF